MIVLDSDKPWQYGTPDRVHVDVPEERTIARPRVFRIVRVAYKTVSVVLSHLDIEKIVADVLADWLLGHRMIGVTEPAEV